MFGLGSQRGSGYAGRAIDRTSQEEKTVGNVDYPGITTVTSSTVLAPIIQRTVAT